MWMPSSEGGLAQKPVALKGSHAKIYKLGVSSLHAAIDAGDDEPSGTPFDKLQADQQIALLASVSHSLLDRKVPAPQPAAMGDLAVWAAFRRAGLEVVAELQAGVRTEWRRLVIKALREMHARFVPTLDAADPDRWVIAVSCLGGRYVRKAAIRDYEKALDKPRHAARCRKGYNLPDNYFIVPPPDPRPEEVEQARLLLSQLMQPFQRAKKGG